MENQVENLALRKAENEKTLETLYKLFLINDAKAEELFLKKFGYYQNQNITAFCMKKKNDKFLSFLTNSLAADKIEWDFAVRSGNHFFSNIQEAILLDWKDQAEFFFDKNFCKSEEHKKIILKMLEDWGRNLKSHEEEIENLLKIHHKRDLREKFNLDINDEETDRIVNSMNPVEIKNYSENIHLLLEKEETKVSSYLDAIEELVELAQLYERDKPENNNGLGIKDLFKSFLDSRTCLGIEEIARVIDKEELQKNNLAEWILDELIVAFINGKDYEEDFYHRVLEEFKPKNDYFQFSSMEDIKQIKQEFGLVGWDGVKKERLLNNVPYQNFKRGIQKKMIELSYQTKELLPAEKTQKRKTMIL